MGKKKLVGKHLAIIQLQFAKHEPAWASIADHLLYYINVLLYNTIYNVNILYILIHYII